jgi:hypothetical protein
MFFKCLDRGDLQSAEKILGEVLADSRIADQVRGYWRLVKEITASRQEYDFGMIKEASGLVISKGGRNATAVLALIEGELVDLASPFERDMLNLYACFRLGQAGKRHEFGSKVDQLLRDCSSELVKGLALVLKLAHAIKSTGNRSELSNSALTTIDAARGIFFRKFDKEQRDVVGSPEMESGNKEAATVLANPEKADRVFGDEQSGQELDFPLPVADALSRLDDQGLRIVLSGLSEERLHLVLRAAAEMPLAASILDRDNPGLGTVVKQMLTEGASSLTRDELRKLQTFAANRLKEEGFDQRVKERAIADDIFPPARALFPDRIALPSDVNADSLTALFREKAEDPATKAEPLSVGQLESIKELSLSWRKHFQHVHFQGEAVNVSLDGDAGLKFRAVGKSRKSMGYAKLWPLLEFFTE